MDNKDNIGIETDNTPDVINEEIEILIFKSGGNDYAMKVSDVKEILPYKMKPTPVPNSHPNIEGIIMPREELIPIINLMKCLNLNDIDKNKNEMLIVTNISNLNIAFHVDRVVGIHRMTERDIKRPSDKLSTSIKGLILGVIKMDDSKILLLDLKYIINDINPEVEVD